MEKKAQMMLFSFLAYYDFLQSDTDELESNLRDMLLSVKQYLNFSDISWGPVANKGIEILTNALLYAVRNENSESEEYTIVIRGTNPFSLQSWLFQDMNVAGLVPWSRQSQFAAAESGYISKATDTSLSIHKNMQSGGNTILEWLDGVIDQSSGKPVKLNICGHSLGGVMATTFALWLSDELEGRGKIERVDMQVFAYAAPTAGEGVYVHYLNRKMEGRYWSFRNYYDLVPHAWKESEVKSVLPDIYGALTMNDTERKLYDVLSGNIRGLQYEKLRNEVDVPSEILDFFSSDYLVQAAAQHVFPYLAYSFRYSPIVTLEVLMVDILRTLIRDAEWLWNILFGSDQLQSQPEMKVNEMLLSQIRR